MERDVPNFDLSICLSGTDGPTKVATQGERGGFLLLIHQRERDYPSTAFEICGRVEDDALVVEVWNNKGQLVSQNRTVPVR